MNSPVHEVKSDVRLMVVPPAHAAPLWARATAGPARVVNREISGAPWVMKRLNCDSSAKISRPLRHPDVLST
ncbi:MAG: hypothetical protein QOG95_4379 [Mycobacterium sp.]|jgi:hypothetical protein|nr:hypothetical protein [Mycobacterium sp.]